MLTLLLASAGLLLSPPQHPAAAQGVTADQTRPPLIYVDSNQPSVGAVVIDEVARRILYDYYQRNLQAYQTAYPVQNGNSHGKKNKGLPPGLAKKSTLPPGIQKQLARNGQLPPGLQYHALPPDLLVQLPAVAPGYRYVIVDDRVMLIRAATNVIMDLLQVPGL